MVQGGAPEQTMETDQNESLELNPVGSVYIGARRNGEQNERPTETHLDRNTVDAIALTNYYARESMAVMDDSLKHMLDEETIPLDDSQEEILVSSDEEIEQRVTPPSRRDRTHLRRMQEYDPDINPALLSQPHPTPESEVEAFRYEVQRLRQRLAEYQALIETNAEVVQLTAHKNIVGLYTIALEDDYCDLNEELLALNQTTTTDDGEEGEDEARTETDRDSNRRNE